MRVVAPIVVFLLSAVASPADFSYTVIRKGSGGASVAGRNTQAKYYFKGAKMKVDRGERALIIDFNTRTATTIDNVRKTISAAPIAEAASQTAKIEVREPGEKKMVAGHPATESILTVGIDSPELRQMGAHIQMEMELWLAGDMQHPKRLPGPVLGGDGNPAIEAGLASLQNRIAAMPGVPVLEVVRVKPANAGETTQGKLQPTAAQAAKMRDAMADLDATIQKGGPGAARAAESLAIMNAVLAPQRGLDAAGAFFEITLESKDFSSESIPESIFALPSGYTTK